MILSGFEIVNSQFENRLMAQFCKTSANGTITEIFSSPDQG